MKYCIRYYRDAAILNKVDEIIIQYKETDRLIKFVRRRKNQRVILDVSQEEKDLMSQITLWRKANKYNNLSILMSVTQLQFCGALHNAGIPYFFKENPNNIIELIEMINLGISDVYIADDFAFELKAASILCKKKNVHIRLYPNVAQGGNDLSAFFVRPEDLDLYAEYVDCIEFYGPYDRQTTLYRIYVEDKCWHDRLGLLILGLNDETKEFINDFIISDFGFLRLNCNKKCNKKKREKCNICNTVKTIALMKEEELNNNRV